MTSTTQFFLYGETPVKMEPTSSGGLRVSVFDPSTGSFFADSTYRSRILYDRDDMARAVSKPEFDRQVAHLHRRELTRRLQKMNMDALGAHAG